MHNIEVVCSVCPFSILPPSSSNGDRRHTFGLTDAYIERNGSVRMRVENLPTLMLESGWMNAVCVAVDIVTILYFMPLVGERDNYLFTLNTACWILE